MIVSSSEKKGGRPFHPSGELDLLDFMQDAGIFYADFLGSSFTWCNNRYGRARIWKRLDRMLINSECLNITSFISISHLVRKPSDHAHFLLSFFHRLDNTPRPLDF